MSGVWNENDTKYYLKLFWKSMRIQLSKPKLWSCQSQSISVYSTLFGFSNHFSLHFMQVRVKNWTGHDQTFAWFCRKLTRLSWLNVRGYFSWIKIKRYSAASGFGIDLRLIKSCRPRIFVFYSGKYFYKLWPTWNSQSNNLKLPGFIDSKGKRLWR